MKDQTRHWDQIYTDRDPARRSWTESSPATTLELLFQLQVPHATPIIDIGAGAATLIDALLEAGYTDLTALDLSAVALQEARSRLADRAAHVAWEVADILTWTPARPYGLWHDRACFHFLTSHDEQARYREVLRRALSPGGYLLLATFGPAGPEQCSGLTVQRHDAGSVMSWLGDGWTLITTRPVVHRTPWGSDQGFVYVLVQRDAVDGPQSG